MYNTSTESHVSNKENPILAATTTSQQHSVSLGVRIYSIDAINAADEFFEVDMRIFLYWGPTNPEWRPSFGSNIYVSNATTDVRMVDDGDQPTRSLPDGRFRRSWRVVVRARQRMQLQNFPFDCQTLQVKCRLPRVHDAGITSVSVEKDQCEWRCQGKVVLNSWDFKGLTTSVVYDAPQEVNFKPDFTILIKLQRRSGYYVRNICVPVSMIVLLNFAVFAVPTDDVANRVGLSLAVLLACIAFKFSVGTALPVLDYETTLEVFANLQVMLVFLSGIESIFISRVNVDVAAVVDIVFAVCSICAFVSFGVYFLVLQKYKWSP